MAFADTDNKATIRCQWDLALLECWRQKQKREKLTYLGLPGPEAHDLLDWRSVLDPFRTGVESMGRTPKEREVAQDNMGRLNTNLFMRGMSSGFELLCGDMEDIILDGFDQYGKQPQINDGRLAHMACFGYDLVNLDFDGGLGYKDGDGAAKRILALKKLFERQEGHSFVLFLTINVRDTMGSEIEEYLLGLQNLDRGPDWRKKINWYLKRSSGQRDYKLKVTVPSFIHAVAEMRVFRCTVRPPIAYEGHERAHMIHFAFELEAASTNGHLATMRGFSLQDDPDLIDLPLLRCENGQLRFASVQHPDFDYTRCAEDFCFLPGEVQASILATSPRPVHAEA